MKSSYSLTFPFLESFPFLLSFFFADFEASPSAHDAKMRAIAINDPAFMVYDLCCVF